MEIKYVYEKTQLGWGWQVVLDGQKLFYPFGELKGVKRFVKENLDILIQKLESEENHGLAFYACGYDGQSQSAWIEGWEEQGVSVF
jgi:gp17